VLIKQGLFDARVLEVHLSEAKRSGRTLPQGALELVRNWHDRISSGSLGGYSETQIEQAFNSAFFVDLLEYDPIGRSPEHHIVPKRTGDGRDIPDFVLGKFIPNAGVERWVAVGETKGINSNLDLPQASRFSRETPVEQAFRYASKSRVGVEWVIVTNFREIRLYRNGYTAAYHAWRLEELINEQALLDFYLVLGRKSLLSEDGRSFTLRLLDESVAAGLQLTEGFYGLYQLAHTKLVEQLRLSPFAESLSPAEVFAKAYKILNRVLFAAFCEDSPAGLLPPATLARVRALGAAGSGPYSYWRELKRLFSQLNAGAVTDEGIAYNAFNGGLFAPDEFIDEVDVDNEVFETALLFRQGRRRSREIVGLFGFDVYDFSKDLDVQALGAIFEQSLKDLEKRVGAVRGRGDAAITEREDIGVYYTPSAITSFMVARALDAYLAPVSDQILEDVRRTAVADLKVGPRGRDTPADLKRDILYFEGMIDALRGFKIIDPACGSGAFLVEGLRQLHEAYEALNSSLGALRGTLPLFGLHRLILRENLHGADILPESVEIARLSVWLRTARKGEPLESLDNTIRCCDSLRQGAEESYDVVIGNPPWGAELPGWTNEQLLQRFPAVGQERDSYAAFIMRSYELLRDNGVCVMIIPNSWLTVTGYAEFRRWLLEHFEVIEVVNVWKIFDDVNHDSCILVARKRSAQGDSTDATIHVRGLARGMSESAKLQNLAQQDWAINFQTKQSFWAGQPGSRFETIYDEELCSELDRIAAESYQLSSVADVTVGVQVYHRSRVPIDVIRQKRFHSDRRMGADWYPFIRGNNAQRFFVAGTEKQFLLYSDLLHDKRELDHYRQPRIIVQQIFWRRLSAVVQRPSEPNLYLNSLFSITLANRGVSLDCLAAILNSRFVSAAYERWSNRIFGDKFPKVSAADLGRLPIPRLSADDDKILADYSGKLHGLWAVAKSKADDFKLAFSAHVSSNPPKLNDFWNLSSKDFSRILAELGLSGDDIVWLLKEHRCASEALGEIWSQISQVEEAIDDRVKRMYGVNDRLYDRLIERAPIIRLEQILLGQG
jgi:predicted RNA methylase